MVVVVQPERVVVWLFPTVGTPDAAVLRGRVFLSDPDRGSRPFWRNLRSIVAAQELPNAALSVEFGGTRRDLTADGEGFFQVELVRAGEPLPLGTHPVRAYLQGVDTPAGEGTVTVVASDALSIVSDLDDTIAISHVPVRRRLLRSALLLDHVTHGAVPGMAALFRALAAREGRAFHYLSGTPVGLLRRTMRFLARNGFPPGALVLRHLESEPFKSLAFKRPRLETLVRALPGHSFVLFGDTGEGDPELYAEARERLGDRVRAIFLRNVTGDAPEAARYAGAFLFERPSQAAEQAARQGLIAADAVAQVEAAERGKGGRE